MRKIFLTVVSLFSLVTLFAQDVIMGDVGYLESNPADCSTFGASPNFKDDGVDADYTPDFNDTTTFCPDLTEGTKMTLTWAINAGFEFDVDGSDSIYVFDGPDASSPLLGTHNSATDPNGFAYAASWNNPSGCLTVVFISDGATQGTGWLASATCGNPLQPFEPHIEAYVNGLGADALNPSDTGFVDICFGDSILFITKPIFLHSSENNNGHGYSQTIDNVSYDWYITDGGTYPNNDSVWFTPPQRSGYIIDLKITDNLMKIERIVCKTRVSTQPFFSGTGPFEDSVCLGENTYLTGGHTSSDTVGVDIPGGNFQLGGSFAGLTYLPDGSGQNYEAPIEIGGFPAGSTIQNSQDLNQVCITMEHSFLGDLEMLLECPSGAQVTLLNSYTPASGIIPGGVSGGSTFMGDPIDDVSGGGPGEGWEYCFSSVFATWGDYPTEFGAGNTIPAPNFGNGGASLNPNGVYLPETDFNAFIGCPVNGEWKIVVRDNLGTDDGYIFEWGLFFDPSFFAGLGGYQNTIASSEWLDDPTIISGQDDTVLVIQPNTTGITNYTFTVTDDFGCDYDTTVALFVMEQPQIFNDTVACNYGMIVSNTQSFAGGVWTASDTSVHFNPNNTAENPEIWTTNQSGAVYTVTYTDNRCNSVVTAEIDFPPYPWTYLADTVLCQGVVFDLNAPNENSYPTTYEWNDGTTGESISISQPGTYFVVLNNICHQNSDTVVIDYKLCDIQAPNVLSLAPGSQNTTWFVIADGLEEFNLVITSRWGNVIYECNEPNANCIWDGRDRSGNFVGEGTYFYLIDAKIEGGEELQKHGFIQVID